MVVRPPLIENMKRVALINLTSATSGTVIGFTTDEAENLESTPRYNNISGTKAVIIENLKGFSGENIDSVLVGWTYNTDCFYPPVAPL